MSARTGATIGFVASGLAVAIVFNAWPAFLDGRNVVLVTTVLATVIFLLQRYELVSHSVGAPLAGGFALLAVVASLIAIGAGELAELTVAEIDASTLGPFLIALFGVIALVGARIDWVGVDRDRVLTLTNRSAIATVIGVVGILSIAIWGAFLMSVGSVTEIDPQLPFVQIVASTLAVGLGTATVAGTVLSWSGRGLAYIDASIPDRRGWVYVVLGTATLLGANIGIEFIFSIAGTESTTHSLVRTAQDAPEILLVLVPLSYLVVGPGEELLYRNVIQKYLAETFSEFGAIVVASVIFACVHLPAYTDQSGAVLEVLNTLSIVFVLSLVLGVTYYRTRNVIVSALIHGSFNAIAFALTYLELTDIVSVGANSALA